MVDLLHWTERAQDGTRTGDSTAMVALDGAMRYTVQGVDTLQTGSRAVDGDLAEDLRQNRSLMQLDRHPWRTRHRSTGCGGNLCFPLGIRISTAQFHVGEELNLSMFPRRS
jgi:hypothetical protein